MGTCEVAMFGFPRESNVIPGTPYVAPYLRLSGEEPVWLGVFKPAGCATVHPHLAGLFIAHSTYMLPSIDRASDRWLLHSE